MPTPETDPLADESPRGIRWQVRSRISRMITRAYGLEWTSRHYRAASDLFRRWERGEVHERDLQRWLEGRLHGGSGNLGL